MDQLLRAIPVLYYLEMICWITFDSFFWWLCEILYSKLINSRWRAHLPPDRSPSQGSCNGSHTDRWWQPTALTCCWFFSSSVGSTTAKTWSDCCLAFAERIAANLAALLSAGSIRCGTQPGRDFVVVSHFWSFAGLSSTQRKEWACLPGIVRCARFIGSVWLLFHNFRGKRRRCLWDGDGSVDTSTSYFPIWTPKNYSWGHWLLSSSCRNYHASDPTLPPIFFAGSHSASWIYFLCILASLLLTFSFHCVWLWKSVTLAWCRLRIWKGWCLWLLFVRLSGLFPSFYRWVRLRNVCEWWSRFLRFLWASESSLAFLRESH